MLYVPIALGALSSAGITGALTRDVKKAALAGVAGAGFQVLRQYAMVSFEKWVERQLLYQLYLFSGTRLFGIMRSTALLTQTVTMTAGAATAGVALGATVGSVGAMAAEELGLITEQQEADALGFYTGGIQGNNPNYWSGDRNDSGYFNIPRNLSIIWSHYF